MSSFFRDEHGESLLKICSEHSGVIPGESYTMLEDSHERLRSITHLQHKAQALETVKAERRQIQQSLRQRESELADFLENALEGVQQVGPDQRILWANRALLNLLGYSYEEYVNHTASHFHVDTHVFDEYWQRLMRREDIYDYPAELRCKDGSVRHVLIQS
ncbi:MAG: hybrid sensor histidine kinase/response regulator, partial [Acidobacteria bacterium]